MTHYAEILDLDAFKLVRETLAGRIVTTSGGYDPIHPGHAACLVESKKYGDILVAIVNGDSFLREKKGRPFMDLMTRSRIVSCIRGVDYVIPFEIEGDSSVVEAIRHIRPHVFTKGGDRTDHTNISEWGICQELGVEIITGVGPKKEWSSSDFLQEWGEYCIAESGDSQSNTGNNCTNA